MAERGEPYLNGAFYGPSIPPENPTRQNPVRFPTKEFKPYNLLCIAFKIFTSVLIVIGIVVLALWLIYQPHSLKAYVDDASLSTFNLTGNNNNTLFYSLALNTSIRNPNQKYEVYYKRIEADAYYHGARFGFQMIPTFRQPHKNTTALSVTFSSPALVVGDGVRETYNREKSEGFFYIDVKLYLTVRLKMIIVKSVKYTPDVDCYLRLPAPANATSAAAGFARTECDVDSF